MRWKMIDAGQDGLPETKIPRKIGFELNKDECPEYLFRYLSPSTGRVRVHEDAGAIVSVEKGSNRVVKLILKENGRADDCRDEKMKNALESLFKRDGNFDQLERRVISLIETQIVRSRVFYSK